MYSKLDNITCPYEHYYTHQAGSGVGVVFKGSPYQRGHGIGSFLGGLFRSVLPLLSSGAKAIGKEALTAGVGLLTDMANSRPMEESIKGRLKNANSNLKRKADEKIDRLMSGSGYITKRKQQSALIQSLKSKAKVVRNNKKTFNHNNIKDIFTN